MESLNELHQKLFNVLTNVWYQKVLRNQYKQDIFNALIDGHIGCVVDMVCSTQQKKLLSDQDRKRTIEIATKLMTNTCYYTLKLLHEDSENLNIDIVDGKSNISLKGNVGFDDIFKEFIDYRTKFFNEDTSSVIQEIRGVNRK